MSKNKSFGGLIIFIFIFSFCSPKPDQPNILFIIADDWSYPHASVYGDPVVQTPNFDRIAKEGILFNNAFVSSPSCTPSRAAVVTGQHFWRLEEGANLYGPIPKKHQLYPDLLEKSGYLVGYTDKGWGPGQPYEGQRNPAGDRYDDFGNFLKGRDSNKPFCFWFGSYNPHRGYENGSGKEAGIDIGNIDLPSCFPESDIIRKDVADYYKEVQDFDDQIGGLLAKLDSINELENTLIVVTSDNGMPFPRCKSNLYDLGTRVPLAVMWGGKLKSPAISDELISLTDLAPTFLEAAHIGIPKDMTGKSFLPLLTNVGSFEPSEAIFFGKERHVPGQESGDWGGYPSRSIRTKEYSYIKNYKPDAWPAGTPNFRKATFFPSYYGDVDGGPTRTVMVNDRNQDEQHQFLFDLAFEKRPAEELYDINQDPHQLHNLATDPAHEKIIVELRQKLVEELERTSDPRYIGNEAVFSSYPYSGGAPQPDHFVQVNGRYATEKLDSFPSKHVPFRDIEILMPIKVTHNERFPVIYMMDGQNLFHEHEGWGGELSPGWKVDEVLDSLFLNKVIGKAIVVGISNLGMQRRAEYMPAQPYDLVQQRIKDTNHEWDKGFREQPPISDNFLKFIVEELKPYIDENYLTKSDQPNTFIAGSSMGGLISAYAICEYPEVFGGAACLSTHWPPLDGVFVEYIKAQLPDPANHKIYFDYGTEGLDADYEPFQQLADAAMERRGFKQDVNWMTRKYSGEGHHEKSWAKRLHVPFEFLLGRE